MPRPGLHQGGRVVARAVVARFAVARSGRVGLFAVAASLAGTVACTSRGESANANASASEAPDAAISFTSQVVTNPASWNSLWGSWPQARYDHAMAYDSDLKRMVVGSSSTRTAGSIEIGRAHV